ncbi:MAG TPA: hypothetical protein VHW46_00610 [Terracidiphilus sp.]|nr:hypothetical protein [Terracidiphilus sp.]
MVQIHLSLSGCAQDFHLICRGITEGGIQSYLLEVSKVDAGAPTHPCAFKGPRETNEADKGVDRPFGPAQRQKRPETFTSEILPRKSSKQQFKGHVVRVCTSMLTEREFEASLSGSLPNVHRGRPPKRKYKRIHMAVLADSPCASATLSLRSFDCQKLSTSLIRSFVSIKLRLLY